MEYAWNEWLRACKKVRAEAKYEDMPIIMVTTEGGKAEVITALKAGVNNYIVKPYSASFKRKTWRCFRNW